MSESMDRREREAGLYLAGNDTMRGRRGGMKNPSMSEREAAAGLNLRGNNTTSGRKPVESKIGLAEETATRGTFGTQGRMAERGTFGTQGRLAGEPKRQRDSEDGIETVEIRRSGGLGGGLIHAFQLVIGTDGSGDPALFVRKGTVNGEVPTISGTPLDDDYEANELAKPSTGSRTYWLKITSTGGDLDDTASTKAAEIITTGTDPGADTATQAKQTLGSVTTDSGAIESFSSNLSGSQNVDSCGTLHSWNVI